MPFLNHVNSRSVLVAAALAAALLSASASAQAIWPNSPIKLIVPFAAGGADVIARAIGTKLSARLGQPIVIENKGGAGGTIGTDTVAKAPADGYTLLFVTTAIATNAASGKKLPFNLATDLVPIGLIAATPLLIVGPANSPVKTLRELIDFARAKPNSISYGSNGVGSMSHIGMELLASEAKVQFLHVPYRGTSLAVTDLVTGQLQAMMATFATSWQLVEGGKLRSLAVTSAQRSTFAPNVPTVAEAGVPGAQIEYRWGLMGPAHMSPAVVRRLNDELNSILAQADMREILAHQAATPKPGTPEDFGRLMTFEVARWTKLINAANIRIE
jgi:tripartite-type tricarboxylate transporter receptor subunit TctC